MSEQIKINLNRIAVILVIVVTLASAVGGGYITYDNAKTTRADFKEFKAAQIKDNQDAERRIAEVENKQARFEGKMDERTANTLKRVEDIYSIVKEWERE
jgi:hypothetical protein